MKYLDTKYLNILLISFLYCACNSASEGKDAPSPFGPDYIPQSPLIRQSSLGQSQEQKKASHSPSLRAVSERISRRRGSLAHLQTNVGKTDSAAELPPIMQLPTVIQLDLPPNLDRPASASVASSARPSSARPDSAAAPNTGHLLPTPKTAGRSSFSFKPSPPKYNPHASVDLGHPTVNEEDGQEDANESAENDNTQGTGDNSQTNQDSAQAGDAKLSSDKSNKAIYFFLAALVASFSILYKKNQKFYNKVNEIWQKIKSKIQYLTNSKPEKEESKEAEKTKNESVIS